MQVNITKILAVFALLVSSISVTFAQGVPQIPQKQSKPNKPVIPTTPVKPKLTVNGYSENANLSVAAEGGSFNLAISTNQGKPQAEDLPVWIDVVSVSSSTILIECAPNIYTHPRDDYFYVTAGKLKVKVNVEQEAKIPSYLRVDGNSSGSYLIDTGGCTKTFSISTDANAWDVTKLPDFCEIAHKTPTSLTIRFSKNTGAERKGTIVLKTAYHSAEINVLQGTALGATVKNVYADYNVFENGKKGMKIHVEFESNGQKGDNLNVCAFFYNHNGDKLTGCSTGEYVTSDGQTTSQRHATATYENSVWHDFTLFIPYDQFPNYSCNLYYNIGIWNQRTKSWSPYSENQHFSITRN